MQITVPSNTEIDMMGATITDSFYSQNTSNIAIRNVIINGGTILLNNVDGVVLENVTIKNVSQYGLYATDISNGRFDQLRAMNISGNAYMFGLVAAPVIDSWFGNIFVDTTADWDDNPFNYPGNPFVGVLQRCSIESIIAKDCAAGIKIYGTSIDVCIGEVVVTGCSTENSGLKVQGDATNRPSCIAIGQITASDNAGSGLYMELSDDVSVASYIGRYNGSLDTFPDVWVGGDRIQLASVKCLYYGSHGGIEIRAYATDTQIAQSIEVP